MKSAAREELPPLENPLILGLVFEHCNVSDLKVCRLVSKVWRDSSLKAWRSLVLVEIGTDGRMRRSMVKFLKFLQDERSSYFEQPYVINFALWKDSQEFWTLCGPSIKFLELKGSEFQSMDVLRNVIFESCPNLEHLTFDSKWVEDQPNFKTEEPSEFLEPQFGEHRKLKSLNLKYSELLIGETYPVSWMELLGYFPSLETLNVDTRVPNEEGLFQSLILLRERYPQKLQLKHVHAGNHVSNSCPASLFRALQDSRLRLVSLELGFLTNNNAREVQEILRTQLLSLKRLCLNGSPHHPFDAKGFFPSSSQENLVNLQELKLTFFNMTVECLKKTPNVKKMEVHSYRIPNGEMDMTGSEMDDFILTWCKEIKINNRQCRLPKDLKFLAKRVPNLETLKIEPLGNKGFAVLCEHFPNIVSVTLDRCCVDDSGITGLDVEDVARINGEWRPITVPRANITALKQNAYKIIHFFSGSNCIIFLCDYLDLQSFNLRSDLVGHNEFELGVCSALFGILQLPQLRHLTIERYDVRGKTQPQNPAFWKVVTDGWGI